jgi:eukaryotic-like serine/threonine-protein kinase
MGSCLPTLPAVRSVPEVNRDPLVGTAVGQYAVQDCIGEGGTAMVYRASHPAHGTVALKILRSKLRADPTAVTRFEREAQFGLRVLHPNVVKTIELGEADGLRFLAIEWAAGELLEKVAKRTGQFPQAQVASIVSQIAAAVQAAHEQGIVHRDLKPENLMYDVQADAIRLLDFGIAAEPEGGTQNRLTRDGFFVGTLLYVAPEALSGVMVGPAADQYSLATIAYFLLTGVHPYIAKSTREMLSLLLSQPPIALNKAKPGLTFSPAIEAVVMRGLSRAPAERYPSITAFSDALADAISSTASAQTAAADAPGEKKGGFFKRLFR